MGMNGRVAVDERREEERRVREQGRMGARINGSKAG